METLRLDSGYKSLECTEGSGRTSEHMGRGFRIVRNNMPRFYLTCRAGFTAREPVKYYPDQETWEGAR